MAVFGQNVEHDELASLVLWVNTRVKHFKDFPHLVLAADGVDQCSEQIWCNGKQAFEDVVVFEVKQAQGGLF